MIRICTQIQGVYTDTLMSPQKTAIKSRKRGEIVCRDISVVPVTECLEEGRAKNMYSQQKDIILFY